MRSRKSEGSRASKRCSSEDLKNFNRAVSGGGEKQGGLQDVGLYRLFQARPGRWRGRHRRACAHQSKLQRPRQKPHFSGGQAWRCMGEGSSQRTRTPDLICVRFYHYHKVHNPVPTHPPIEQDLDPRRLTQVLCKSRNRANKMAH
ncbi:hypothetical protein MUK42_08020 [Musa troglodytarum]|uniref:Uncharacterized protein n=1 Tax=Musa troglodytarum TaxID=320322 RepID=A0A9E7K7A8_9LILI|nr:hypothetical protein MUK42_08020 [Musa troglodytarum]